MHSSRTHLLIWDYKSAVEITLTENLTSLLTQKQEVPRKSNPVTAPQGIKIANNKRILLYFIQALDINNHTQYIEHLASHQHFHTSLPLQYPEAMAIMLSVVTV